MSGWKKEASSFSSTEKSTFGEKKDWQGQPRVDLGLHLEEALDEHRADVGVKDMIEGMK